MPKLTTGNRTRLLLGCGSAALVLALAIAPERAQAQGIQATPNVTQGAASIDRGTPGVDTVAADTPTVVIDWTPDQDNGGNALDFLPTGNTAIFQNGDNIPSTTFSILNRILPATNGNIAVIDGTVISQILDGNGNATPGGFVAFYSPTGILIGNNAVFDVGSLMLTTLDPDPALFGAFAGGGSPLTLTGGSGTTAPIIINPGAGILASPDNSFFVAAAAEVQMFGTALVNGSHAYIGGEIVTVTFNNGLFDIQVPLGSASATPITINGDVGGPSSTGVGDDHIIYAVARAQQNPIGMLFSGNLGFDPAVAAGVVNGEIILSANFDVSGRTVAGGSITDGINAEFVLDAPGAPAATLVVQDVAASSSLLAVSSDTVDVVSQVNNSFFDGDLLVAAGNLARVSANNGLAINALGDALVYSRDIGVIDMALNDPNAINAAGGTAIMEAVGSAASVNIAGNARVDASATGGQDLDTLAAGAATGGTAQIDARGGTVDITGFAVVDARADVTVAVAPASAGDVRGGNANVFSRLGGLVTIGGNVDVLANAFGVDGDAINPSRGSNAIGGTAGIVAAQSDIAVGGDVLVEASAVAGGSNDLAKGAGADAGNAVIIAQNGTVAFAGQVLIDASARGGENQLGEGGDGFGGVARLDADSGASVSVGGDLAAFADAEGGDGTSGGNAEGGSAGVRLVDADADLMGAALADASALGGSALFGVGGAGGDALGGAAYLQAEASLVTTTSMAIAGDATVVADGVGGSGGIGDGSVVAAGVGGNGTGGNLLAPNQADNSLPSGAYILADADNGTVSVGGNTALSAIGEGGEGGSGGLGQAGGNAGDGTGGDATAGLINFAGDGSVGLGSATFGGLAIDVTGRGGEGGFGGSTFEARGDGGAGTGGFGFLEVIAGSLVIGQANLVADGQGGDGNNGGDGTGGGSGMLGALQGDAALAGLSATAIGAGGIGDIAGGNGQGGDAFVDINGIQVTVAGDAVIDASGFGGFSNGDNGGDGTGGLAGIGALDPMAPGSVVIDGNASVVANGLGGEGSPGFTEGVGQGGSAIVLALLGSTVSLGSAQITANGLGGTASGGDATATIDDNSTLSVAATVALSANATGGPGGTASGGEAGILVGPNGAPSVTIAALALDANATGGDTNEVGRFFVDVQAGTLNMADMTGNALGDAIPAGQLGSVLVAEGGDLRITGTGLIDVLDDFVVRTSGGGTIGGPDAVSPTGAIEIRSQGTITIFGDDDGFVGFGGESLGFSALELNIEAGARIGAAAIEITSLDTVDPAILGGTSEEAGFTLTQDEVDRIDAGAVSMIFPEVDQANLDAADLTILDLTVAGSLDAGFSSLDVDVGGIARVEGILDFVQAASTDSLALSATDRIEIVTPGGIFITAPDGSPGGTLQLFGGDIWAADNDMISQLITDPQFTGRDEDLAMAAAGSDDPGGYVVGSSVELIVGTSLLVRNTGSTPEQGGITVGAGGLSIRSGGQSDPLDVFAYGRRDAGGGTFITGEAFFDEVNYNFAGVDPTVYLDASAFNDCIINTGECPNSVPQEPEVPVNNPTVTITPLNVPPLVTFTEPERNGRFGPNFPGLISIGAFPRGPEGGSGANVPDLLVSGILSGGRRAGFALEVPGLSEDPTLPALPLLDDPVASGGDATLYSGGDDSSDEGGEQ